MAAIPSLHVPSSARSGATGIALVSGCVAAALAGVAIGTAAPPRAIDPDLVVLLRAMAAIKALLVVAALGVAWWRFRRPAPPRIAAAYGLSIAAMSFATALIGMSAFVGLAAFAFHAGLLGALVTAWRDDRVLPRPRR